MSVLFLLGSTYAKITLGHGLIYDKLIRSFGEDKARLYLKAQVCACIEYTRLCGSIDCDYEIKDSCVYSLCDRDKIEKEVAEPITIENEPYIMGVILERSNDSNRFYVHELLIENGASPFKTGAPKGLPGGDAPSLLSLLQMVVAVKQNGVSSPDKQASCGGSLAEQVKKVQSLAEREAETCNGESGG